MRLWKGITLLIVCLLMYFLPDPCNAQQKILLPYVDSIFAVSGALKSSCSVDNFLKELRTDPKYVAREKKMNDEIYRFITNPVRVRINGNLPAVPVVLPVVVHIINDDPSIITKAMVDAGIKDLNDAFSKSGAYSASKGADTKIQFVLAQKDPDGGITTGITRTTSHYAVNMNMYNEDQRLKNLSVWDPSKYINVWLINNIVGEISAGFSCGVWTRRNSGGYATLPTGFSYPTDGIVVPNFGIVLAHEMGHYLGLYHTFDGGCNNNNCLTDGDRVCDTPPDGSDLSVADCSKPGNSCSTDTLSNYSNGFFPRDTTDQVSNFMDYNNPACTNQFTEGQAERMHATLNTQRQGLLNSAAIAKPCTENVLAGFTRNVADPKIGETVNFANTSVNAASYEWYVDGGATPVAVTANLSRSFVVSPFPVNNKHTVTLKAFKNGCMSAYTDYILVNCGLTARFSNNKRFIASQTGVLNDTILFTNNSMSTIGPATYDWILIDYSNNSLRQKITTNATGAGTDDLNYIFPKPGNFGLKLIATNGGCADSSDILFFNVADPRQDAYMSLIGANCFQDTKVRVSFFVCNFGYAPILPGLPVTFYDDNPTKTGAKKIGSTYIIPDTLKGYCCGRVYVDTLDVGYEKLNKLYAVANNITTTVPLVLPDPAVTLLERDYTNDTAAIANFRFKATVTPSVAVMEPGDTLQLRAQGSPDAGISYAWSPTGNMSCTTCNAPLVYADTNALTTKRVIVKSAYQCNDTAYVDIKVPAYNDYTVTINAVLCAPKEDSLTIDFTVTNQFKKGIIPKNLQVAFYKNDPQTNAGVLLPAVFTVPDSVLAKQKTYRYKIKKVRGGILFASVNDKGSVVPVIAANAPVPEKVYTNNFASYNYQLLSGTLDTAICNGETFAGHNVSGVYSDTILTAGGCDSVRIIRLTVKAAAVTRTTVNVSICEGLSYAGHNTSGTYVDTYPGTNTCDSIRTLNLVVNPVIRKTVTITICRGNNYFAAGKLQTQSGVYIDSAKSSKGCDSITTTNLTVDAIIQKTYGVKICKGNSYFAGGKLQTQSGTYTDTTQSAGGCDSVTITNLSVNPLPALFLPKDTTLCPDKTLPINLSNYTTVNWSTGSTSSSITITQAGVYGAQVTDRNGCTGTDSIHVAFEKCIPIQIPSAFTPNNDGKNDVFRPTIGVAASNYTMQIWSRWGQLVFETRNPSVGWNGKYASELQPNGVYIYIFSFTDPDGFPVYRKGTLLLLR